MPRYEITGPDGHRYEVTAPDGASEADVLERVKAEAMKSSPATPAKEKPPERTWYGRTRLTKPQHLPNGERIGELPPGAPEPEKYEDPNDVVAPAMAALGLGGAAPLATAITAPLRYGAAGLAEPGLAEIAATVGSAGSAVGSGMKSVATSPAVREALKWLARGALGAEGFDLARRLMK